MNAADSGLVRLMDDAAARILGGRESPYEVASEVGGGMLYGGTSDTWAKHGGTAYAIWAEISDIYELGEGPDAEERCNDLARAVSEAWLATDRATPRAIRKYFNDWDPYYGRAISAAAGWTPGSRWAKFFAHVSWSVRRIPDRIRSR